MKTLPLKQIVIGYTVGLCIFICSFFIDDPFPQHALNAKVFSEQETSSALDEIPFSLEEVATEIIPEVVTPVSETLEQVIPDISAPTSEATEQVISDISVPTPETTEEAVSTEELVPQTTEEQSITESEEKNTTPDTPSPEETTALVTSEPLAPITPVLSDDVRNIVEQFSFDSVIGIQNAAGETVYVDTLAQGSLWLFNASTGTHQKIGEDSSINTEFPIGVKDGILFWVSEMNDFVFAYNTVTSILSYQPLPSFDPAKGERVELTFPDTQWVVIVTHEVFYFYTPEVGEVFSDQNTTLTELLEKRFNIQLRYKEEEPVIEELYNENE